jgi:release factor glutamine methyltransferase
MLKQIKQSLSVWLIKKIQRYGPHRVHVMGHTYYISEDVFNPKYYYTSRFMARHIRVKPEDTVLDMGTGSGIQALTAGRVASGVIAVDINPEAAKYAGKNVKANGLEDVVSVIGGDLFSPLAENQKFNVIIFTPPYMEGNSRSHFDHALFDARKELACRFFRDAGGYLKRDGYVQMLYSSIAEPQRVLEISRQFGWHDRVIAHEKVSMEGFFIYRLTRA